MTLDRDARSTLIVLLVAVSALTVGWTVRGASIDPVRRVSGGGLVAELPADWLAASGAADVAITAHRLDPVLERVQIGLLQPGEDDSLEAMATDRSAAQARQASGYRVVDEGPEVVAGRPAHSVTYAMLETPEGSLPVVVEGQAHYIRFGDTVVVASVEADSNVFPEALLRFHEIVETVEVVGDEQ